MVANGTGSGRNTAENLAHVIAAAVAENAVESDHLGHQPKVARCYRVTVERRQQQHVTGDDFFTAADGDSAVAGDVVRHRDVEANTVQASAVGLHLRLVEVEVNPRAIHPLECNVRSGICSLAGGDNALPYQLIRNRVVVHRRHL